MFSSLVKRADNSAESGIGRCQDSCRLFALQLYLCYQGKRTIAISSGPLAHPEPSDATLTVQSCHSFKRLVIAVLNSL